MNLLQDRLLKEGKHLGKGVLKVDSFMNHQVDPLVMRFVGEEFARRFRSQQPTRILTAETSGIAPALATGLALNLPVVFARKHQPVTMQKDPQPLRGHSSSPTHGKQVELIVSSEYVASSDRILIIDDFLASAKTIVALIEMAERGGAKVVGIGAVIEKAFLEGRQLLGNLKVPIESLAIIEKLEGENIILRQELASQ